MKKNLFKKSMSVFLSVLMLMSCWVFMPATHEHLEAEAAASESIEAYNLSLVNGLTDINTAVTTIYGSFEHDNEDDSKNYITGENYAKHYKNVLYSPQVTLSSTPAVRIVPSKWKDNTPVDIKYWYAPTTVLYDGITNPQFGIMLEVNASNNIKIRSASGYISSGANGLTFATTYWKAHVSDKLKHIYLVSHSGASDGFTTNGTWDSVYVWTHDSAGADWFFGNDLVFSGAMSDSELLRSITPVFGFAGQQASGDSQHFETGTANFAINVINYVPVRNVMEKVNTLLSEIKTNPGKYTPASVRAFVNMYNTVKNAHPNNHVNASKNDPAGYNTAATNAINAYNNFSLAERKYEVNYENLFSLTDWYYSESSRDTDAYITTDLSSNYTKIYKPSGAGEYTTASSYPNAHKASMYAMDIVGGKDYTIAFESQNSGNIVSEVFMFWYDANGNPVQSTKSTNTFDNHSFGSATNCTLSVTFTAPANAAKAEIRFDNDGSDYTTAYFKNIRVYPAERAAAVDMENWTARPARKAGTFGVNLPVGTQLDIPARPRYDFNGWYVDADGNGTVTYSEYVTDANGVVTRSIRLDEGTTLYADWVSKTLDIGYDNLFSLSDWAMTDSAKANNNRGEVNYDLEAGTITVNSTKDGEEYTTYSSSGNHYQIAVKPGTEYVFEADMDINDGGYTGQMFVFFYNASGAGVPGAIYNGTAQEATHIGIYPNKDGTYSITFTTAADCTKMAFRVGATQAGATATYSNIGLYEKDAYDAYAKDYVRVREPFKVGDVKTFITPAREGYVFDGWVKADGTPITSTEGLSASETVYATWTILYTVTFYNGDGTVLDTAQVKAGEALAADQYPLAVPTKESDANGSYEFESWSEVPAAINGNVSVTPNFKQIKHENLTYYEDTESTCEAYAKVQIYCDCGYYFGVVDYDPSIDPDAESHKAWLPKGHEFTDLSLILQDGTATDTHHLVTCVRYGKGGCTATTEVEHTFTAYKTEGADCVTQGTVYLRCACLVEKTELGAIDPDGHKYDLTAGTSNGDGKTHTVVCENDSTHTKNVNCSDYTKDCKCDICGQELIHVYDQKTKTNLKTAADCYNDAVYYLTCKCGKASATETWIDTGSKLSHNWTNTKTYLVSAADCENDAVYNKECSLCNAKSEETWTDAGSKTGHNYNGTVRNNNNGTHSYLCANSCGTYGYNGVKEASTGCTYGAWSKTEADNHTKTCSECGYSVTEDHSWSKWTTVDGATADAVAQHKHSCNVCGREETTGCDYEVTSSPATCTAPQVYTYTCKDCGHVYTAIGTEATGHTYTGAVHSLGNGKHNYSCANGCGTYGVGANEGESVDCSYSYTNSADGKHIAKCAACSYAFEEKCSGGEATCTAPATCGKCKTSYGTTVPHSFKGAAVQLEGDFHAYLCEFCGDSTGISGVGANIGGKEACSGGKATCSALAVCEKCSDEYGSIDANAHKWGAWTNIVGEEKHTRACQYDATHVQTEKCYSTSPAVASPDCNTEGFTLNTCEDCGHTWKTEPIAALGHNWGAWTNNGDGTHTRVCVRNCGYSDSTETVSCTKENAKADVKEPTCLDGGYTTYTCNDCGYVWTADPTDAKGHSYAGKSKIKTGAYLRSEKDCVTDLTYWYRCDRCEVSAETEKDKYNEADLFWVSETATGHSFTAEIVDEAYLKTASTCTTKAVYYKACSACKLTSAGTEEESTFEYGTIKGHTWVEPAEDDLAEFLATPSDCITDATYYYVCDVCGISSEATDGKTWTDVDSKSGHSFDYEGGYTAGVKADCDNDGMVEHYTCETCGKHFTDKAATTEILASKLVIAKLGHDYKSVSAKEATCEEGGYTKHMQCQREGCGKRNNDYKEIAAKGHDFKAENGYYTDTAIGYHAYKCSNCAAYGVEGVKYSAEYDGMDWIVKGGIKCEFTGEYVNYTDENGIHSHKLICVCGNESSEVCEDAAPEHIAPTCTEAGYYVYTCDVCGFVWNVASDAEEDKALEHDLKVVSNGNGTHSAKCERNCGYEETAVKCSTATPSTDCGTYDVCDICKTAFGDAKPHVFTNYVYDNNAACGKNGTMTAYCDTCKDGTEKAKDVKEAAGTALEHIMVVFEDEDSLRYQSAGVWKYNNAYGYDLSKWAGIPADFDKTTIVEPTCKENGLAISYCTREGCAHYTTKVAGKVDDGHVFGEWLPAGGSCATGVTYKSECTLCGKVTTKVETVPHEYVLHTYVPATCEEASLEYYICSVCGDDKEEHTTEALGHTWDAEVIDKEATCGQTGRKYNICSVCSAASEMIEIPRTGHVWDAEGFTPDMLEYDDGIYVEAREATCQFEGHNGYYKCLKCSYDQHLDEEWRKENVFSKKAHEDNDNNGKCDECNDKVYGDDGEKNCSCICHKDNWFAKIIYKILRFFWKLFKIGKSCDCGTVHY